MSAPPRPRNPLPFVIPALVGLLFLVATLFVGGRQAAFVYRAAHATGTFQGAIAHSGGNHGGSFLYPQFSFKTDTGQTITFTSKNGSTGQPYNDGQSVPVLYDPVNPNNAVLNHFWSMWAGTIVLAVFTLGFLGLPCALWFSRTL